MKHSRDSSFWKTGCVTKQSSHYSLTLSLSPLTLLFRVSSCSINMYFSYLCLHYLSFFIDCTAWKVSKYGDFSGPYFPVFGPEKTPYLSTFHAVLINSNFNLYQHFSSSLLMCPDGVKVKFFFLFWLWFLQLFAFKFVNSEVVLSKSRRMLFSAFTFPL